VRYVPRAFCFGNLCPPCAVLLESGAWGPKASLCRPNATSRFQPKQKNANDNCLTGIVNLTVDTRFPEISLDAHVPKYKGLACQRSSILPIYREFYH
jgi:hypothetical protein